MKKETHKCKSNPDSNLDLPTCSWESNRCHSPCDLIAQSPNRPQADMVIETPDGLYPSAEPNHDVSVDDFRYACWI